jgi:hypothetical protein
MSFIVALASDASVFPLQCNKAGIRSALRVTFPVDYQENRRHAAIYARPSNVSLAHGSIQMPYEIYRSAVISWFH